jgi:hypothetical protein
MVNSDGRENSSKPGDDVSDSVARVEGYVGAEETFSSLKSELLHLLKEQSRGDAEGELRRIERRSHRRWMGFDSNETDLADSVLSDYESLRKVRSGSSSGEKSIPSERSKSSASLNVQNVGKSSDDLCKVQLKKEVGAWWGRKCAD